MDRAVNVDYLLCRFVDQKIVAMRKIGNILVGVAPFAIERGMVPRGQ